MSNIDNIEKAADYLRKEGVILIETDTNFALCCIPRYHNACTKIYQMKGRDKEKPLTLFISDIEQFYTYSKFDNPQEKKIAETLINTYWPGPLNLVVPSRNLFPENQYFEKDFISIAYNHSQVVKDLINFLGEPLAMTSANISGESIDGLITESMAKKKFGDNIPILSSNQNKHTTQSSTIVRIRHEQIEIIRQGDVKILF